MFSCLGSVTLWVPALQCRTPNIRTLDFRLNAFSSSTPIAAKFAISSFVAAVGSAASFFCSNDLAALNPPLPIFRATSRIASSLSLLGGKTGPLPTPHLQLSELPAVPCRTPPTVPPSCPSPPSAPLRRTARWWSRHRVVEVTVVLRCTVSLPAFHQHASNELFEHLQASAHCHCASSRLDRRPLDRDLLGSRMLHHRISSQATNLA